MSRGMRPLGPSAIVGKEPDLEKLLPEVDVIELHEPAQIAEHHAEALPTVLHVSGKLKLASSYGDDYQFTVSLDTRVSRGFDTQSARNYRI